MNQLGLYYPHLPLFFPIYFYGQGVIVSDSHVTRARSDCKINQVTILTHKTQ